MRLKNRRELKIQTRHLASKSDNRGIEGHETISRPPTSPSYQAVQQRTTVCGKKRNISEAFAGEKKWVEIKSLCRRPNGFEKQTWDQSAVVDPDVSQQSFFFDQSVRNISHNYNGSMFSSLTKVRLNLPRLIIPEVLPKKDEKAMHDLHVLLKGRGFEVNDGPTLAFFAVGAQHDTQAAALFFQEFYKLARTWEIKFPECTRMDQMAKDCCVEGFARHHDGTYGGLLNFGRWNVENNLALNVVREFFCYHLNVVDFSHLKRGVTVVANMRNLEWRRFAPIEIAKTSSYLSKCIPIKIRKFLFVEPSFYASVALKFTSIIPSCFKSVAYVLSLDEAHNLYPDVLLPPSLTPITKGNERFTQLSVDEQVKFQILIE